MKKNFLWEMLFLSLVFCLVMIGCTSTGNSTTTSVPNGLSNIVGKWRGGGDGEAFGSLEIKPDGNGSLKMYQNGTAVINIPVSVTSKGQLSVNNKNVQHTIVDVIVNGNYFGEKLTVKGFIDSDLIFYKTNPPKNISLSGTSWTLDSIKTTYIFKEDGTFSIDIGPQVEAVGKATWGVGKIPNEGTYSINGNEVTLSYPDGVRVIEFYEDSKGPGFILSRDKSLVVFIEGVNLITKGAYFKLVN